MTGDTISRAAALTALGEEPPVWYDGEDEIAERDQWRRDVAAIKALPSAQLAQDLPKGCTDTISRQAMLNEIDIHVGILYDSPTLVESLKFLVRSLPSAQPGWIPITEGLPEEETIYLITFGSGHVRLSSWHKDTKYNHGFDNIETGFLEDGTMVHFGVTAWMPLPKPWENE